MKTGDLSCRLLLQFLNLNGPIACSDDFHIDHASRMFFRRTGCWGVTCFAGSFYRNSGWLHPSRSIDSNSKYSIGRCTINRRTFAGPENLPIISNGECFGLLDADPCISVDCRPYYCSCIVDGGSGSTGGMAGIARGCARNDVTRIVGRGAGDASSLATKIASPAATAE